MADDLTPKEREAMGLLPRRAADWSSASADAATTLAIVIREQSEVPMRHDEAAHLALRVMEALRALPVEQRMEAMGMRLVSNWSGRLLFEDLHG